MTSKIGDLSGASDILSARKAVQRGMAEPRKAGRPSKGPRKRIPLKVPIPLAELIEQHAKRNGVYVNDWVIAQLAASVNFPLTRQEQLPLNDAA
jgi:hypothetical protein